MRAMMGGILVLALIGEAASDPKPALTLTALQGNPLSVQHAWTAQVSDGKVRIQRPGKSVRTRHPKPVEVEAVVRVLKATRFDALPERLGVGGACDDCSRCVIKADMGDGTHQVVFEASGAARGPTPSAEEVQRFLLGWRAIKALAGVVAIPDLCP